MKRPWRAPGRRGRLKGIRAHRRVKRPTRLPRRGRHAMSQHEVATLAGGCFWCLEAVFEQLRGVTGVTSGYAGGHVPHPTYEAVCTGTTGHAEVVQIAFDPAIVTYRELLEVFFTLHDPTTLNRQGPDTGTQYRSAIFYHTAEQRATAEQVIKELEAEEGWGDPPLSGLVPLTQVFPPAGDPRGYLLHNPNQGYCRLVIAPKVAKLRKLYLEKLKQPVA